jgi:pimeloyl-ACP methyl ester carboxylesterase
MEAIVTTSAGVQLCWEGHGDPADPALLLIAGHSAQLVWWQTDFIQLLVDAGFYVIRFDNRDVGRSQHFPGVSYGPADMADDAAGLLAAIGIQRAHVVGQSMGGMIAQSLVLRHPEIVRSLSLLFTSGNVEPPEVWPEPTPVMATKEESVTQFLTNEEHCNSRDYPPDLDWRRRLGEVYWDRGYDPGGWDRQMAAIFNMGNNLPALHELRIPVSIQAGSTDLVLDPQASHDLHAAIPDSTLTIYDGMGHELPRPLWHPIVSIIVQTAYRAN